MVVAVDPDSVPVIAPVDAFKLPPPGNAPDTIEYEVASVAATVKLILPPASTFPKLPAAVVHAGTSDTVNNADPLLTALPSLFSILMKYVPSVPNVKLATNCDALVNVIEFADVITPVELIASTIGTDMKFDPLIVTLVASFVITVGLIEEIVGFVSLGGVAQANSDIPFDTLP